MLKEFRPNPGILLQGCLSDPTAPCPTCTKGSLHSWPHSPTESKGSHLLRALEFQSLFIKDLTGVPLSARLQPWPLPHCASPDLSLPLKQLAPFFLLSI